MAAAARSSMPSRLRQLLLGESIISPSLKLDAEPPPKVKAFIDKVIQSPLQDIAIPLSGFRWEFGKGNFHHWRPLFLHFDTYFKAHLASRNDLILSDDLLQDDSPLPKNAVVQILRVMQIILENCHNKSAFDGLEHFKLLLASSDPEILIAGLETLAALVKINPSKLHGSGKLIGCASVNSHLLSLAQGWGSKEEGLGLYSCVIANERTQEGLSLFPSDIEKDAEKSQHRIGSTLYFELHGSCTQGVGCNIGLENPGSRVIHIPNLHLQKEDDLSLMKHCVEQYNVPPDLRFSLFTRIRFARAFRSPRVCRLYSRICLLAFIVLVQSNDANDELTSFFANEPEYTNELIRIVRSEETIPGSIRTLAMLALGAQLAAYSASHDRARILSGSSISFAVGNRMILLNVLQRAVLSLKSSNDPSSFAFVEALLQFYLLHIVSSSASGGNVRGSGMVSTFLPLLEDSDPNHLHLVYLAVKALQKLMDYSSSAVTLLRESGGVELLSQRLQIEVHRIIDLVGANDTSMVIGDCSRHADDQVYSQKRLVKVLLKALGSATYAPANNARAASSQDSSLPSTLSLIYGNAEKFGGDIYYAAVTVMSEIIHKDPTCFSVLHEMGLPDAFLSSVTAGILPSAKALTCIPNGLGAICLNAKGLEAVKDTSALRFLVDISTSKKYVLAMNEAIAPLANAVEELLRHVSSLRGTGVDIIIEIIGKIASFEDISSAEPTEKGSESTAMDTDSENKENEGHHSIVGGGDSNLESISNEQFMHFCIFHLMVLLHRTMENTETCRLFVEKSGIEALLNLLVRPSIIQSSEGMCIALHSTLVFKGFTQHHSATLARAFCSFLRDHLKKALAILSSMSGLFLLDPRNPPDTGTFSSLFLIEFLLFLAASKDNRWVNALLTEFGNGSKDVLEDIGQVHREVLWQLAMLEDSKLDLENDVSASASESDQAEQTANESEEQRFNSFRQFLDPLLRRRTSGWSIESQFFDLINLYRDLGRATGVQQRLGIDAPSSRFGSIQQPHSESSDAAADATQKESDKQKSLYNSCCDMVRSLSFHITHLFQELGKTMALPSRRREDNVNVSPSTKVVASTFASIALGHMEFGGHVALSGSEVSISTKCRYYGKVVNFIDGTLLDRPDSCNPILLNCFYGRGVVQAILTTFKATSQLPFAVNRPPASPMETDDGNSKLNEKDDVDHSWIYGPLESYGKLMDHLVTSSLILSPFTKQLLVQPLVSGGTPFPRDAETFVKILQSMVLKALLPLWTHPQFADCSNDFIGTVISIIKHVYSGVEVKITSTGASTRIAGPPPNETTIATIVEMGFSRPRAEEALRQVGSNSVELAMEWLFSHPEEIQEDDELARALAMSLGNSEQDGKEDAENSTQQLEEDMVQLPPIEELLSTCSRLLEVKESLAFPVRDLLVLICSQNDGQYRSSVISFILDQMKGQNMGSDSMNGPMLCALFHVLALILHEDTVAREVAAKNGLVNLVLDLLSVWDTGSVAGEKKVPKWVTTAFLAIDQLLQIDQKLNSETLDLMKRDNNGSQQTAISIDENKQSKLQCAVGSHSDPMDFDEQKTLIQIACSCIKKQLPSETMHAVLQLCSTLTRNHAIAVCFLETDGVNSLLSLPTSSLFPGFDNVAATIIRHILEDPQTLQQAMETEIRHKFVAAANRHTNGRVTPRNFLLNVSSVIARDPVVFLRAAQSVCQIEMVGERPYVVLMKERDKDKNKEKEKEKEKLEKEKVLASDAKVSLGNTGTLGGNGQGKLHDSNAKSAKAHRKCPQSFTTVIELLLDSIINFEPPQKDDELSAEGQYDASTSADMDIDVAAKGKGKGKAIAGSSKNDGINSQEASALLAKVGFILKLLTEIVLMYPSAVHVLLKRDSEIGSLKGVSVQKGAAGQISGSILHHILNKFIPLSRNIRKDKKADSDWRNKLASRASQFLVASCIRSAEARRRVFTEISFIFNDFVNSCNGFRPPTNDIQAYVDLLNDILAARTPTGSYISAEASVTFVDVGLVRSLTRTLEVLDLDHADSPKIVTALIKVLELVTKEHVNSAASGAGKGESPLKQPSQSVSEQTPNVADVSRPAGSASQSNHGSMASENIDSFDVPNYGRSEAVTDDMEHDQDLDGGFPTATDDDYMQENSEDVRAVENGMDTIGIHFDIQPPGQEGLDEDEEEDEDEDEEMSGDDGDDVDDDEEDDDEGHNDLEEDGIHHLPHPDTDQDDHDIDDEFDEEVLEDDDEDDDEDEDGVILRLEEGNGVNVFDHIEVFGRDTFSNDALRVMPVEIFGSRRQGRTTSIYNLLGRSGDVAAPSRHPLLTGPSSTLSTSSRQSDNARDMLFSERNLDTSSSHLETIFRSLRNGRHGQRFNFWMDEIPQSSGSSASIPQGLEDLLVSQLRRPTSEKTSDHNTSGAEPQHNSDVSQQQELETDAQGNVPVENNADHGCQNVPPPTSMVADNSTNADVQLVTGESQSQVTEMQFEQNDAAVRDVEAVSQESGGSGATLGESLRSLDVEIGSADGHDDGGDRQGSTDRMPLDPHISRARRGSVSFGNATTVSGRDATLHSVTEVSENSSREVENDGTAGEQPISADSGSGSIDPTFLDALPEELRAEVLSAQQGQVAQPSNTESQNTGDIDPEFLAALPPDIRAEVLAQQQAQRLQQSHELEGQPVEMDTVSIIATFPSDLREEVLLTSSDAILANLTPALVAEANMLRERFAHRYRNRTLFGNMHPRSRRGESSRRGEGAGYGLERDGLGSRRPVASKLVEAEGAPLVETESLQAMVRVLQIVQPLYKGPLQRLFLNLSAHGETRTALVKILMDMLMLDTRKPINSPSASEPAYRLYACQSNVMYSRPQSFDGVPPLVSRRVLETLTYLARNHLYVARILLQYRLPMSAVPENNDQTRGKALMVMEEHESDGEQIQRGCLSIALLLSLLNQPLYLRSIAHLEQLLNLLEVIINSAERKSNVSERPDAEQPSTSQNPSLEPVADVEGGGASSSVVGSSSASVDLAKVTGSGSNDECDTQDVLSKLPQEELRLLCSLLAREGLSDNAYSLVAEVMKRLVAIAPIHCHLFISELAAAVQNLTKSAMNELHMFGEAVKALLCTSSSDGAAILRVLQALSSLVSSLFEKQKDRQILPEKEHAATVSLVCDINAALEPLWLELSTCISKIESYSETPDSLSQSRPSTSTSKPTNVMPPLPAGSQNILPYIESFFVMCEKLHPAQPGSSHDYSVAVSEVDEASASATQQKSLGPVTKVDEKHIAFVKFSDKHRKLLNAFVRQNPGLLEKSFSLMLKVPRFIDFDNKRAHFRSKIKHHHDHHHHSSLRISVRRAYILEDSYNQLRLRSTQDLKGRLTVHFQGEEGIDAGGLTREWYQLLSRVIFDKGALLFTTVGNESTFQPNPNSVFQTEHLSYFKFVGRVVGKALFDGQLLDVHFTRSFYKHILGVKVTYHDIEAIDPDYFKNLKWMLENDISDLLDLTFSIDADEEKRILYERTEVTDYELIPGGRNIKVTEENKHQYVDLVAEHRLTTAIRPQINAFLEGFNELIPRELITIFHDKELELLISGLPDIDFDDMRANTEYSGYSAASPIIQWFWEVVQAFSKEDKARLLQFVTGTSKVPLEGFSALQGISGSQKFQIHKAYGSPDHLPSAHTCFNQLDLPEYPSKEHLEERLLLAIHEANEGFGFG